MAYVISSVINFPVSCLIFVYMPIFENEGMIKILHFFILSDTSIAIIVTIYYPCEAAYFVVASLGGSCSTHNLAGMVHSWESWILP